MLITNSTYAVQVDYVVFTNGNANDKLLQQSVTINPLDSHQGRSQICVPVLTWLVEFIKRGYSNCIEETNVPLC